MQFSSSSALWLAAAAESLQAAWLGAYAESARQVSHRSSKGGPTRAQPASNRSVFFCHYSAPHHHMQCFFIQQVCCPLCTSSMLRACTRKHASRCARVPHFTIHHLVANAPVPLRLKEVAHAQQQQPHKLAREPAAQRAQPLLMRQRHVAHLGAGKGAGRRKADEREQGNALRVAELQQNKRAVEPMITHWSGSGIFGRAVIRSSASTASSSSSCCLCLLAAAPPLVTAHALRCVAHRFNSTRLRMGLGSGEDMGLHGERRGGAVAVYVHLLLLRKEKSRGRSSGGNLPIR